MELKHMTDKNNSPKPIWEEGLELIVAQDEQAKIHARKSLNRFLESHEVLHNNFNFNNIFMTANQFIQNLFKKHVLVAYVTTFLLIMAVAGVTAEATAPEEFKPSTQIKNLFASNTQNDKDPYTALKPDDKNHVVALEKCDLSAKYPQKIAEQDLVSWDIDSFLGLDEEPVQKDIYSYIIERVDKSEEKQENGEISYLSEQKYRLQIDCGLEDIKISKAEKVKYIAEAIIVGFRPISLENLKEKTGWFITESDLKDIYFLDLDIDEKTSQSNIMFTHKDRLYNISWIGKKEYKNSEKSINFNNIQLQFNSVVKNQADIIGIKVEKVENQEFTIVNINSEDLGVRVELNNDSNNPKNINASFILNGVENLSYDELGIKTGNKIKITGECRYNSNRTKNPEECYFTKISNIDY